MMPEESVAARKKAILDGILVCPRCQGCLKYDADRYECMNCGKSYPVTNGIPRFVGDLATDVQQVSRSFNLEHSKYLDSRYVHFGPQLMEQWLENVQLPPEYFKGKVVLDVGCGSGRWTYALASLGAAVVAVDLTDSGVEVTRKATEALDHVAVLQAEIFHLPFKPDSFDFVVSWGVLHHTAATRAAFDQLVPLVKKKGQLYIMVYEKHNPFKFVITNAVRYVLRRLPEEHRYKFCGHFIIKNRPLWLLLSHCLICIKCPDHVDALDISTIQFGLYDAYSPLYNHLHTRSEVISWFRKHNFDAITLTRPILNTRRLRCFLYGECGGFIHMRGTRA